MTLTKDEQQQVDTAVTNNCVCTEMDCVHSKSFRRGVDFALQHLFAGRLERFAEWCDNEYFTIQNPSMAVAKYLQYLETLKQKEDGDH